MGGQSVGFKWVHGRRIILTLLKAMEPNTFPILVHRNDRVNWLTVIMPVFDFGVWCFGSYE